MTEAGRFNYQRYLASREWAVLREKVRERAGDCCERCFAGASPMQAVHHLTYERIGHERLDDLQAVCNPCHEFLSGKRDDDRAEQTRAEWVDLALSFTERIILAKGLDNDVATNLKVLGDHCLIELVYLARMAEAGSVVNAS